MRKRTFVLALDDSGTRYPDRRSGRLPAHGHDWFSMGGVFFDEGDESLIRDGVEHFRERWSICVPLHSVEIRARTGGFSFLGTLPDSEFERFQVELETLLVSLPVFGHACVIDRPGYNARYEQTYKSGRWPLCKSAFSIVVERSAKYAAAIDGRLRVYVEKSDKATDENVKGYFGMLRDGGMPFSQDTSAKYSPADQTLLKNTLFELRLKAKTSPLMQVADLFLWPLCMSGYKSDCVPFKALRQNGRLIDNVVADGVEKLGIKYYCFDNKKPS